MRARTGFLESTGILSKCGILSKSCKGVGGTTSGGLVVIMTKKGSLPALINCVAIAAEIHP